MIGLIEDIIKRINEAVDLDTLSVKRISKGFRFTCIVLEPNSCGFCFSVYNAEPVKNCTYLRNVNSNDKIDIKILLGFLKNPNSDLDMILGVSIMNAISQFILNKNATRYNFVFEKDPVDLINFTKSDRVVMVGNIGKLFSTIQNKVSDIVVIDEYLDFKDLSYSVNSEETQEKLEQADIVILTGSSIANNTLEQLLNWSVNARVVSVVGPSAGMIPDPLFERGVEIVSGMKVLNSEKVAQIIEEGGGTPHFRNYCRKYNIIRGKN